MPGVSDDKVSPAKANVCGLEVPYEINWTNWKVGKEYQKTISIKNPSYEPRKVKLRMPPSNIFKMIYDKKIFIAPGNVFKVPILFIPKDDVEYLESLEIRNKLGCFCITLHAIVPQRARVELRMPSNVDMGTCAVGHKTNASFQICNAGSVDTTVSIESLHPLFIQPQQFPLKTGDFVSLGAVFTPHLAKSFSVNAVVRYGNNLEKSSCILFTGRAKYALLQAFICPKKCCHQKFKCPSPVTNCNCNNVYDNNNTTNNNNNTTNNNNNNNVNTTSNNGDIDFENLDGDDGIVARTQLQQQTSTNQLATTSAVYKERSKFKNKVWSNKNVALKTYNKNGSNSSNNNSNNKDNSCNKTVPACRSNCNNDASSENNASEEVVSNGNGDDRNVDHRVHGEAKVLLNFGEVMPGGKSRKHVIVKNMSTVDTYYTVIVPRHEGGCLCCGDDDECSARKVFHLEKGEGLLKAGCSQEVTISFRPKETGLSYKVELLLQSSSGLKSVHSSVTTNQIFPRTAFTCIGRCSAPKVFLCKELLCFPVVELPGFFTKNLEIINQSQGSVYFQFQVDNDNSTFQIEPQNGELPGMGRTIVRVTFAPKVPMNYYRKVACLVHHKGVMNLQLLGTCRSGNIIPVALDQSHLARYDCFCREGLSFLSPKHITGMLEKGYHGKDGASNNVKRILSNNEDFLDDGCTSGVAKCMPHISTDANIIDFGNLEFGCPPMKKDLCLTNHTRGSIIVQWIYCHEFKHFSVVPNRKLVGAEQSAMFTFTFEPTKQNQFYSSEFECFATPELFSSYKTTDERILFPPWFITVTVSGNSFGYGCERFHPRLELDRPLLTLRSVRRHAPTFKTIRIFNAGKDPAVFQLERDGAEMFLHKPSSGLIFPGANQIILFMFNPLMLGCTSTKIERCFKLVINDQPSNDRPIRVRASMAVPSVTFGSGGKLTMRPTCTGLQSMAKETVSSSCCTPLYFKWIVPVAYEGTLGVEPSEGFLGPFEAQAHTWHFKSCHYEDKLVKVRLQVRLVSPDDDGLGEGAIASGCHGDDDNKTCPRHGNTEETSFGLKVLLRGTRATLVSKDDRVKVGPLLVGTRCSRRLTEISNDFDCDVVYKLHVVEEVAMPTASSCPQSSDDEDDEEEDGDEEAGGCDDNGCCGNEGRSTRYKFSKSPPLMRIFPQCGVLPSRTKQTIHAVIDAVDRRQYRWNVSFTLHDSQGNTLSQQPEQRLFQVTACGIIPELSVADICSGGSAKCISRSYVWRMFSVDRLNTKIKCDVGNNMKRFSQSQTGGVDFHFPAGPIGIKPCGIILVVKNSGFIPCEWKMFLPSDLKIKVNKWAESGEMTPEEYREMEIVDNKLFTISPGRGLLDVGQSCCVTLTYDHLVEGKHVLPVILKIKHGNEVKINLCGLTVPKDVPHLHLPIREFRLEPVFLGACQGPLQSFEVLNSGSTEVNFTVDTSSLEQLAKANYDYRVMECLSTSGCIKAGEMGIIIMRLNPIEAKIYSVDLTIQVEGGDCYLITFTGEGKDFRCRVSKSDQTCSSVSNSSIPDQQMCVGPEQICRLSVNQLDFGDVPTLCTVKRLVMLRNCSQQHSACYKWNVKNPCHAQVVKIEPSYGCLNPCDSVMSKVILRSGDQPSILEVDLICEISNLTELTKHSESMRCYLEARQKVLTEVDFSEVDHNQDINCIRNVEFEGHPYADELKEEVKYPKYKTLPPIVRGEPPKFNRRVAKKTQKNFAERPRTPTSEILLLTVRAKTYDINEHKILFPENHRTFFFDRCIGSREDANASDVGCDDEDVDLRLTLQQYEMMGGIFSSLLRDLLDDESFVSSCVEVSREPMPYFQQFVEDKKETDPCKPITNIKDEDEEDDEDEKVNKQPPEEDFGNQDEASLKKRETMKKSPGFGILSEGMLEDTLFNIIQEAYHGEFSITARPRLPALGTAKDRQKVTGCEQSDD